MSYEPNTPLLLASPQQNYMRHTVTRFIILTLVTLSGGFLAVLAFVFSISVFREMGANERPFGYILIGAGLFIAFILITSWISALRQRPAEYRFYEDGMTLHNRKGEQFAAFDYSQVENFSVVKDKPTLYTFLFGIIGALLGPLFSGAVKAAGEWIDSERDNEIAAGSERDIARTQIVIKVTGITAPFTIDKTFVQFPVILERLPPLVKAANPRQQTSTFDPT